MAQPRPSLADEQIRAQLRQRREALREEIADALENAGEERLREVGGEVRDAGDSSVADMLADVQLSLLDAQVEELRAVEQALVRMDGGTWGWCGDCGREIERPRLEAMPTATRCLACQEKQEHDFEAAGPRSL